MNKKVILDSCIWIAFLNKDDSQHYKAVKLFTELENSLILPEYIIIEVTTILSLKVGPEIAKQFIGEIMSSSTVEILLAPKDLFDDFLLFYKEQAQAHLSFIDMYLLWLSHNYILYTFDAKLEKAIQSFL